MARHRFTILGCGASPGVPRITGDWGACDPSEPRNRRTRCSALIERFTEDGRVTRILVDTGPDLREQIIRAGVSSIDGVIYTHSHADHAHGIDDLRGFWISTKKRVDVYTDDATQERLEAAFGYCFNGTAHGGYPPILRRSRIAPPEPLVIAGPGGPVTVIPFPQSHGDIATLGLRIGRVAYSCDVKSVPEESLGFVAGLDVWIVDSLRVTPHASHFNVAEALEWIARLRPERAILTHMTNDLDYGALRRTLPEGVEPAHDGLSFDFEAD